MVDVEDTAGSSPSRSRSADVYVACVNPSGEFALISAPCIPRSTMVYVYGKRVTRIRGGFFVRWSRTISLCQD